MKKLFSLITLIVILMTFAARAGWQTDGNLGKLSVTNYLVNQYVLSPDGKFLFVLDNKFMLRKFDASNGNLIWERDASIHDSANYTFAMAKISANADLYATASRRPEGYLIQVRNIEDGTKINSWIIARILDVNFIDFSFSGKNLTLSEGVFTETAGRDIYFKLTGMSRFYKIEKDSLIYMNTIWDYYLRLSDIDMSSSSMLGYYSFEEFLDGDDPSHYPAINISKHYVIHYDLEGNSLHDICLVQRKVYTETHPDYFQFNNIHISKDGKFAYLKSTDSLMSVALNLDKVTNTISYNDTLTSITSSNDDEYLLQACKNSIRASSTHLLDAVDTLTFPGLTGAIENLCYSPDGSKVYFKNGGNICRFSPDFKLPPLKAYFYTDTNNIYTGQAIHFFNCSPGYPGSYLWDFGDGNSSVEKEPVHVYSDTGHYDVKLTAYKGSDSSSYIIKNAVYVQPFMKSSFSFKKYESDCPVRVEFTNTSLGSIDSVLWDFGDGSQSKDFNPVHNFDYTDTFNVALRIFSKGLTRDTTIKIDILFPFFPIDKSKYKYEYTYPYDRISEALQGYESRDGELIFNKATDSVSSIISTDIHNDVKWENNRVSGSHGLLKRRVNSGDLFLGYKYNLWRMNESGDISDSAQFMLEMSYFDFNGDLVYMVTSSIYKPGAMLEYYFIELDSNLEMKSDKYYYKGIGQPVKDQELDIEEATSNVAFLRYGDTSDIITRYWYKGFYHLAGHPAPSQPNWFEKSEMRINGKLVSVSGEDFYEAMRLNKNKNIIRLNDNFIYAFKKDSTAYWRRQVIPGAVYNNMLRLSDTAFAIVGSINGQPGYIIYNENGDILDSASVSCRYGSFNHVSVTPDTNLLFSGYVYKNVKKDKQAYFVKTGSDKIKSYLPSLFSGGSGSGVDEIIAQGELNITPNPTTGEVIITGVKPGQLKIDVLDVYGGLAMNVYDGDYKGGEIKFNLSGVADGMYFIRTERDGEVSVRKVVKLR